MIKKEEFSKEQKEQIDRFNNFYDEDIIKAYSKAFQQEREKVKNEEYYESYFNVVKNVASLIKELKLSDPFAASIVFEYLLWNGYLSKDKKLVYSMQNRINNIVLTGADIMRGKSVCLNNAAMFTDVLERLDVEAYLLTCLIDINTPLEMKYKPSIQRNVVKPSFMSETLSKFLNLLPIKNIGNHAVTLFSSKDLWYISDPTNLTFMEIDDFLHARMCNSDISVKLKPWSMLMLDNIDPKEFKNIVLKTFLLSDSSKINDHALEILYEKIIEFLNEQKSLLNDFHDNIDNDIDTVCKTLKKVK